MLKIGITGGIGSGKSTVAKIFSSLGIPVYDADRAAKRLVLTDLEMRQQIIQHFGQDAYIKGQYNKKYISEIVFSNREKLNLLNSIIHPATIADANRWFTRQEALYALKEAALIFESNSRQYLDYVIGVFAPEAIRIQRTIEREGITSEQVKDRIAKQMNEDEKMRFCN
ncbi:MAG: dephospho-CoA kinase [Niabella sp.]